MFRQPGFWLQRLVKMVEAEQQQARARGHRKEIYAAYDVLPRETEIVRGAREEVDLITLEDLPTGRSASRKLAGRQPQGIEVYSSRTGRRPRHAPDAPTSRELRPSGMGYNSYKIRSTKNLAVDRDFYYGDFTFHPLSLSKDYYSNLR